MLLPRAIVIVATPADLRTQPGPALPRYVWILSLGAVFRWAANSALLDDGFTVVVPLVGGFQGAWLRARTDDAGAALADADATITVGSGYWRTLPVATLTAPRVLTLDPTNAAAGDPLEITRLDTTAHTLTLVNGGPAAGTITVMPAGARSFALAQLVGSNFVHRRSALML